MRERVAIAGGLGLFLILVTFPVWYGRVAGTAPRAPELARPAGPTACVAPAAFMRASHMDLLADWRDRVVRRGDRTPLLVGGTPHARSVTGTCLKCHAVKADFCDRCHTYAGVTPQCWGCHVDPRSARPSSP
jgi:hypothetical protein